VDIGVTMFLTDRTIAAPALARAVEERGYHSLYFPEHTHIPTSRLTPPPTGDETLDESYARTPDPFVSLAAAAAVTDRILLGTGVALVAQHDPIVLAKQIATLDQLAGGRFVLGVGYGWNKEEMAGHGVDHKRRRDVVREHMLAMNALWSSDVASFDGEFVQLAPSWSWPKPVQQPRVRTLLGGRAGPELFAHIAEYADGWMPIGGAGLGAALPELRRVMAEAGRDPDTLRVMPFGAVPDRGKLDHYESLGASEVVLRIPAGSRDEVLPVLDEYAKFLP
jgi:probable F420-dependent oxidoreductase